MAQIILGYSSGNQMDCYCYNASATSPIILEYIPKICYNNMAK